MTPSIPLQASREYQNTRHKKLNMAEDNAMYMKYFLCPFGIQYRIIVDFFAK